MRTYHERTNATTSMLLTVLPMYIREGAARLRGLLLHLDQRRTCCGGWRLAVIDLAAVINTKHLYTRFGNKRICSSAKMAGLGIRKLERAVVLCTVKLFCTKESSETE